MKNKMNGIESGPVSCFHILLYILTHSPTHVEIHKSSKVNSPLSDKTKPWFSLFSEQLYKDIISTYIYFFVKVFVVGCLFTLTKGHKE